MSLSGYTHSSGAHCGSSSLRNLATHYGWDFDEAFCFGLGAGLGFGYYQYGPASRTIMGRNGQLETGFFDTLGVEYDERSGETWQEAWGGVRSYLKRGIPVFLFVDLYYLEYFDTDTHFGPHVLLCVGVDGDEVLLSDSEFDELQRLSTDALERAWDSEHGFAPLDNHWLAVASSGIERECADAIRMAIDRTTTLMLSPDRTPWGTQGVSGIQAFADELPDWHRFEDAQWCARFAYQNIERRGTGGGAFRRLYADFLEQASEIVTLPDGCAERLYTIADDWTALASTLKTASEHEGESQRQQFEQAADQTEKLAEAEKTFFTRLQD